jgi:hypothetical protein
MLELGMLFLANRNAELLCIVCGIPFTNHRGMVHPNCVHLSRWIELLNQAERGNFTSLRGLLVCGVPLPSDLNTVY